MEYDFSYDLRITTCTPPALGLDPAASRFKGYSKVEAIQVIVHDGPGRLRPGRAARVGVGRPHPRRRVATQRAERRAAAPLPTAHLPGTGARSQQCGGAASLRRSLQPRVCGSSRGLQPRVCSRGLKPWVCAPCGPCPCTCTCGLRRQRRGILGYALQLEIVELGRLQGAAQLALQVGLGA